MKIGLKWNLVTQYHAPQLVSLATLCQAPYHSQLLPCSLVDGEKSVKCVPVSKCMWACACEEMHVSKCLWANACEEMHVNKCMWGNACEHMHVRKCTWVYACEQMHVSVCTWANACERMHVHTGRGNLMQLRHNPVLLLSNHESPSPPTPR